MNFPDSLFVGSSICGWIRRVFGC